MSKESQEFQELITRRFKGIVTHRDNACNNYFNLDLFFIHINSAIQELRNLTFILQKHKSLYQEFDWWYEEKQEEMKKDNKLKWIVDARNKIVKQEDLNVNSLAYISLVNREEISLPTIKLNPFLSNDEIISIFLEITKEKHIKILSQTAAMPVLQVKKVWIDNDYPDMEILLVLEYVFSYFKKLILEFLWLIGLEMILNENIDINQIEIKKTYFLNIQDLSIFSTKEIKLDLDADMLAEVAWMMWDINPPKKSKDWYYQVDDILSTTLETAKKIILHWMEHQPTVMYLSDKYSIINVKQTYIPDRASKYVWIRSLANELKNNREIFAIILINEARVVSEENWTKHHDKPSAETARGEQLVLLFINQDWVNKDLSLPIYRANWKVEFWELTITSGYKDWVLKPIAEVWGLN
jgi:hypothetical protein